MHTPPQNGTGECHPSEKNNVAPLTIRDRQLLEARGQQISCTHCKSTAALETFGFVQDHYCLGVLTDKAPEKWKPSEFFTCLLRCGSCGTLNYIYTHPDMHTIVRFGLYSGFARREIFASVWDRMNEAITLRP